MADASRAINPNSAIPSLSKAPKEIKATTKGIKPINKNKIETLNACNMLTNLRPPNIFNYSIGSILLNFILIS